MHTLEMLELAVDFATRKGYRVRQEWLDGCPGGACTVRGQKWLFLDPSQNAAEQLELVLEAYRADPELSADDTPRLLRRLLAKPARGPIPATGTARAT